MTFDQENTIGEAAAQFRLSKDGENMTETDKGITIEQFKEATKVFAGDLNIVHHPEHPTTSVLGVPNEYGTYSLTQAENLSEIELQNAVKGKDVVVYIGCMDKRAARPAYDQISEQNPDTVVLTLTMGGGIIQEDVIKRPNEVGQVSDVTVGRGEALKTQLKYLDQLLTQEAASYHIVATGHDCQCGACKFYNADVAVHESINAEKGSAEEKAAMKKLIAEHAQQHIPGHLFEEGKVTLQLAEIDEAGQTVVLSSI